MIQTPDARRRMAERAAERERQADLAQTFAAWAEGRFTPAATSLPDLARPTTTPTADDVMAQIEADTDSKEN